MHRVAVVSAIGDHVEISRSGPFIFSYEEATDRWDIGLDRIATEAAVQRLKSRNPSIVVLTPSVDSQRLSESIVKIASLQPYADPERIRTDLARVAQETQADTIFLISRGKPNVEPSFLQGVGLGFEKTLRERAPFLPYAGLALFVIDAKTLQTITKQNPRAYEGPYYNLDPLIVSRPLGGPAPFMAGFSLPLSEEQRTFITPVLQNLIRTGVPDMLQRMGL